MPSLPPQSELIRTTVLKESPTIQLSLDSKPIPAPRATQVVVQVRAVPINPSDLALLLAGSDTSKGANSTDAKGNPVFSSPIAPGWYRGLDSRKGKPLPAGNEGCGIVVAAGSDPKAQALVGVPVYVMGGKMLGQYVTLDASVCVPVGRPSDASASSEDDYFIDRCSLGNPLTILGFLYTMKKDGHKALVHTAAASQLGRMLIRLCRKLNIPLVNVVRRDEQVKLLKEVEGAEHVLNSTSPTFKKDLVAACVATGATCCFDATGGGKLGGYALAAMEQGVVIRDKPVYSRYGTETLKSLYVYGGLDQSPTTYARTFGFAYKIEGWLIIKVRCCCLNDGCFVLVLAAVAWLLLLLVLGCSGRWLCKRCAGLTTLSSSSTERGG
jgi:NADPH2:quinone reductase